ncbi:hypothetical protein FACS1894130_10540 [Spirochaetia bacterium]|nr:hypothetical protein FACS1894130_10540 [Spirochaetia bacterium]
MNVPKTNPGRQPWEAVETNGNKAADSNIDQITEKSSYQKAVEFTASEAAAVDWGIVNLRLHIEGGKLTRYTVNTERSFLAGGSNDGEVQHE